MAVDVDKKSDAPAETDPNIVNKNIQNFVFSSELAEVYLLLDNISTSTTKSLPPPPASTSGAPTGPDLIEQVCNIAWPPTGSSAEQAAQAATLIRARDLLNRLAGPATGATIAFTLLVAGEDVAPTARKHPILDRLRKFYASRRSKPQSDGPHDPPDRNDKRTPDPVAAKNAAPSRISLASAAFPNLVTRARLFRRYFITGIVGALILIFIITSIVSWDITVGSATLAEWAEAKVALGQQPDVPGLANLPDAKPVASAVHKSPNPAAGLASSASSIAHQQNVLNLKIAADNLEHWLSGWRWLGFSSAIAIPPGDCESVCDGPGSSVNAQWAGALLNILAGAVLPTCYGLLGAGAAVVRQLAARIKASTLAPRHMMLAWVQLTLGAVIGGCIGLFVTTPGQTNAAAHGLLGAVPLSASALCFIAGFGVDGVFLALESFIRRVFNLGDPAKA